MGRAESQKPTDTDPTRESKIDEIPLTIDGPKIVFPPGALQTLSDQSGLSGALKMKIRDESRLNESHQNTKDELNNRIRAFLQDSSLFLQQQGIPVDEEDLPKLAVSIQKQLLIEWRGTIACREAENIAKKAQEVQRCEAVAYWHLLVPLIKAINAGLKREESPSFQQGWALVFPDYAIWNDKMNETYFSKLVMVTGDPQDVVPQIIFSPNRLPIRFINTSGLYISNSLTHSKIPHIGGLGNSNITLDMLKKPIIFGNHYNEPAEVDFGAYWQTFIRVMEAKLIDTFVNRSEAREIAHPSELDAINTDQCAGLLTARTEEVYAWVSRCFGGMIFASCKDEKMVEELRRGNYSVAPEFKTMIGSFMDMVDRMKTEIRTNPEFIRYGRLIDR